MSLGYSTSNIIDVLLLADDLRKRFVDAPEEFKAIGQEVRSLAVVLRDTEDLIDKRKLNDEQSTDLEAILSGCNALLGDLNKKTKKFEVLDSDGNSKEQSSHESIRKKMSVAWKRITWSPSEVQRLRNRLLSNISLLNSFQHQINRHALERVEQYQQKQQFSQKYDSLIEWLTTLNYGQQQSDFIRKRQPGTGQWMLNSTKFKSWETKSPKTLYCPGIPGTGKTMMASIVIDYLETKFKTKQDVGIAYVYCSYQPQQEQKPEELLLSITKQLLQSRKILPLDLDQTYKSLKAKGARPNMDQTIEMLKSVMRLLAKVFIVVDALDEYYVSDNTAHNRFVAQILELQDELPVNIFTTSRPISEITALFATFDSIEIRAQADDIVGYINSRMLQMRCSLLQHPNVQEEIRQEVLKASDGMFLLAQLHMDSLNSQPTIGHIKKALKILPRGMKGLDATYKEAMARIDGQVEGLRNLARRVLSWVTHARSVLRVDALAMALAIEENTTKLDLDFCPDADLIGSICAGLIVISQEGYAVRLVHYTTKEYFGRIKAFPTAEKDIALACITFLGYEVEPPWMYPDTKETVKWSPRAFNHQRNITKFLPGYVNIKWGEHVRSSGMESDERVMKLLLDEEKVRKNASYFNMGEDNLNGLHLSAIHGLGETTSILIQHGISPNAETFWGETALHIAAKYDQDTVIRVLLDYEEVDPNSTKQGYDTPLYIAVEENYRKAVNTLLACDKIDINATSHQGKSALFLAVKRGDLEMVKLLLSNGASARYLATTGRRRNLTTFKSIIKLLLENGADPNEVDCSNRGLITYSAARGQEEIVRQMIGAGANPDQPDNLERSPMSYAAMRGYDIVVRLLIEAEARPDSLDIYGRGPISYAAAKGHEDVVRQLIGAGVNSDRPDNLKRTPISYAATQGHDIVVRLLIEAGVNPDRPDSLKRTPVSYASQSGHDTVVRLLIEGGAHPDRVNIYSQDSISYAKATRNKTIVIFLLESGVDLDMPDINGRTPISYAVQNGHDSVVAMLLKSGVSLNMADRALRTPISYAAERGDYAMVRLLLHSGAQPDLPNEPSSLPIAYAAFYGHTAIVTLLIEHGAELDKADHQGITPVGEATIGGHGEIVRLLLDAGAQLDRQDYNEMTLLGYAADGGHNEIAQLLLNRGADPLHRDLRRMRPLDFALGRQYSDIVEMINWAILAHIRANS